MSIAQDLHVSSDGNGNVIAGTQVPATQLFLPPGVKVFGRDLELLADRVDRLPGTQLAQDFHFSWGIGQEASRWFEVPK